MFLNPIFCFNLYKQIIKLKPMDDSVAATLKINNANTCEIFSWLILKKQKFKIILKNIISIVNNNKRILRLL